jgi:hypothetical protein
MAMNELLCLAESRVHSDDVKAHCLECGSGGRGLGFIGGEVRLKAVQHVKTTGHRVRLTRSYVEELYPKPKRGEAAPT